MITIITCPRPGGVSYIEPLLIEINRQVPNEKLTILKDVPLPNPDNKHIGWKALEVAANSGEDLLFLEDDVRPIGDSLIDAVNYKVPDDVAFTSLHRNKFHEPGIHPSRDFTLSQALKIPHRSFDWLLRWPKIHWGDWEFRNGFDTCLAGAANNHGWSYEQSERNYFTHVGKVTCVRISGYYDQSED